MENGEVEHPTKFMEQLMDYKNGFQRPDYNTYFVNMAFLVATRSTCFRRQVGAVIVKNQRILSTGYNGAPRDIKSCLELGSCIRIDKNIPSGKRHEICRGAHAEQNAIANAAFSGVSIKDSTLFITESPCSICTKMIINSGIKKVVYVRKYIDELSKELLGECQVEVEKYRAVKRIDEFSPNGTS